MGAGIIIHKYESFSNSTTQILYMRYQTLLTITLSSNVLYLSNTAKSVRPLLTISAHIIIPDL